MSQGLLTRLTGGQPFALTNRSRDLIASEAYVRLLVARVCDQTGVPARQVEVVFETANEFTLYAPEAFMQVFGDDPAVARVTKVSLPL